MAIAGSPPSNATLRNLPSVDELLRTATARIIAENTGERHTASLVRQVIDALREELLRGGTGDDSAERLLDRSETELADRWQSEKLIGTHRVINATGVIIHTNLGRAPLSQDARQAIADIAAGYCSLEYDIKTGKRGKRGERAENLLAGFTGAESVLIVNNCAAAAFFVLTAFAAGGEVVISRGEMVEIGGDFRVPEVLSQSGALLREVGTTNRTKIADYEKVINSSTRLILRVHPSNYRIVGFTATPNVKDLTDLAHRHGLMLYEDLGSGALIDLSSVGLKDEPVVSESIAAGVDIVSFSGDKLLGGPQAGIIAGKLEFVERLRSHPLYRALRVDKLTYAALEATLDAYRRDSAFTDVPVLKMLSADHDQLTLRAERFVREIRNPVLRHELVDGFSAIGGGAAPAVERRAKLVAVTHKNKTATRLEQELRHSKTAVIGRIVENRVMLDLRTVPESDEETLLDILNQLA